MEGGQQDLGKHPYLKAGARAVFPPNQAVRRGKLQSRLKPFGKQSNVIKPQLLSYKMRLRIMLFRLWGR